MGGETVFPEQERVNYLVDEEEGEQREGGKAGDLTAEGCSSDTGTCPTSSEVAISTEQNSLSKSALVIKIC